MIQKLNRQLIFLTLFSTIILIAIVLGFYNLGTPFKQKMVRDTASKIEGVSKIHTAVKEYVYDNNLLPETIERLDLELSPMFSYSSKYIFDVNDYSYEGLSIDGDRYSFKICTDFPLSYKEYSKYLYTGYVITESVEKDFNQGDACLTFNEVVNMYDGNPIRKFE